VGVDPAPLVAEFDASHEDLPQRSIEALQSETYTARRRRGPNWTAAMAAVLVLVLGYAVFQLASGGGNGDKNSPPQNQARPTATATASPTPSATPSSTPTTEGPIAVAPKKGVEVKLALVSGRSWISVRDESGVQLYQGVLEQGTHRTFTDKRLLRLVLGNAGAVQLTVNGQSLGAAGGSGQVVHLEFGPGDPQAG
jgi:cytoskeletal protein RodZ